jgi:hypothetical protein
MFKLADTGEGGGCTGDESLGVSGDSCIEESKGFEYVKEDAAATTAAATAAAAGPAVCVPAGVLLLLLQYYCRHDCYYY